MKKDENKEITLFKTPDMDLASALLCTGFSIDATDNSNPSRVVFYFHQTEQLEEVVRRYSAGDLKVDARDYSYCRREILKRIHEPQDNQEFRQGSFDHRVSRKKHYSKRQVY